MAGRNRNTFLKRQKEMDRTRKAREKMARRHGKKERETEGEGGPPIEGAEPGLDAPADPDSPALVALSDEDEHVQHAE